MARLHDVPEVMRRVGLREFSRRVWHEVNDDNLLTLAAALAYSWLFALFPFLIFLLSFVVYLPSKLKAQVGRTIFVVLDQTLPDQARDTVWNHINGLLHGDTSRRGLLGVGLLVSVWAASSGMNMTMHALDKCYDLPRSRPFYKMRLVAIALTVVAAVLILGVLLLMPVGTILGQWIRDNDLPGLSRGVLWAWNVARYTLALLLMFGVLALIYHFGASVLQHFRAVTPGAVFSVGVWILLALLFRLYVTKFGRYDLTYGTAGGVAILLLFFYLDALVLLVGAEINSEIDFANGIPRGSTDFRQRPTYPAADELSDQDGDDSADLTLPRGRRPR